MQPFRTREQWRFPHNDVLRRQKEKFEHRLALVKGDPTIFPKLVQAQQFYTTCIEQLAHIEAEIARRENLHWTKW